jgi:hypothetical protein
VQRRLVSYSLAEHRDLVARVGCSHPATEEHDKTYYRFCDTCRAQRELELAETGR